MNDRAPETGDPGTQTGTLLRYLQQARDALLWKLDGVGEYDARRPLTPTGTNLLGLVKHAAGVEFGYFGETFGRTPRGAPAWLDEVDADPLVDMWAQPGESREDIFALYRTAWANTDAVLGDANLDTLGHVPHWPAHRNPVTLHQIAVHVIADAQRHAGHADILREQLDGAVGYTRSASNLPYEQRAAWQEHVAKLDEAAALFRQ
ncbi:DinB family protein [Prauserella halophila]|uniref:DinB family protein n=1 Tax=Prauserella halophila TaxID=185641 RepID=UPI0020A31D7F|nr:DinB family protein [Prauserella halophila]